jgi:hypothetical protein
VIRFVHFIWLQRRLLAVLVSGLFCFLTVGHYCWVVAGPDSGLWGPHFACEQLEFNCGEVPGKGTVEHDFVIRNAGWQPLHITARAGCGSCSTVKLSKEEIVPGDTSVLKVTLHVGKNKGEFKKQVLVKTDDPHLPKVILYVQGKAI